MFSANSAPLAMLIESDALIMLQVYLTHNDIVVSHSTRYLHKFGVVTLSYE